MNLLLPDILLVSLAFGLMLLDLIVRGETARGFRWVYHAAWLGLTAVLASLAIAIHSTHGLDPVTYLQAYRITSHGLVMRALFVLSALLTIVLARSYFLRGGDADRPLHYPAEFIYLILFSTFGSISVVSACDLIMLFVGLELATIPLYILVAFNKARSLSAEAATKYILMGSVATGVMLFGYSYLYGVTGSLRFDDMAAFLATHAPASPLLRLGVMLILGGIAFKLAAVPFHMWAPDVYAGAPAPVSAFLALSSKATAFAFIFVLLDGPLASLRPMLKPWFILLAVASMIVGNLGALRQTRLLRFMGYSSIAQAGYMLLAFAGTPDAARASITYYLFLYLPANFMVFMIIAIAGERRGETLTSLRGLAQEQPALAAWLATALFSLAGIPPTAGFTGKFMLFGAAAETGYYNLVILAALNSTVSLYYYLLVMREAYVTAPDAPTPAPLTPDPLQRAFLTLTGLAVLILGLWPTFASFIQAASAP